jgi:hypothetical protein
MPRLAPLALLLLLAPAACQLDVDTTSAELAADPIAACPVPRPGAIAGHEADFYRCAEETASCGDDGYLLGYGARYAERFYRRTRPLMSARGKQFIDATLVCLQTTLRDEIDAGTSCDDIHALAYDSHPDCYVASGFCDLTWRDWLAVASTIDGHDWLSRDALRQVQATMRACAGT